MRAVRAKKIRQSFRRARQAQWDRWMTNVALWPFRDRWNFALLVLFPPKKHRQSAAEQRIIKARKQRRQKARNAG